MPSIVFVFTGQGAHWAGMAKELLNDYESFAADIRSLGKYLECLSKGPSWRLEGIADFSPHESLADLSRRAPSP